MAETTTRCPCFVCGITILTSATRRVCDVKCDRCNISSKSPIEILEAENKRLRNSLEWIASDIKDFNAVNVARVALKKNDPLPPCNPRYQEIMEIG